MYQRVGTYDGDLKALAHAASAFSIAWAPDGHGTTTDPGGVREAFAAVKGAIPGEWALAMLVFLGPSGLIPLHRDNPSRENDMGPLRRFHLVLQTNERCWSYHDGTMEQLEAGGIYVLDAGRPHASMNFGLEARIHLVVDVSA